MAGRRVGLAAPVESSGTRASRQPPQEATGSNEPPQRKREDHLPRDLPSNPSAAATGLLELGALLPEMRAHAFLVSCGQISCPREQDPLSTLVEGPIRIDGALSTSIANESPQRSNGHDDEQSWHHEGKHR